MTLLVTREEAALVRASARARRDAPAVAEHPRIWAPPGETAISEVAASGRATCRECGERIAKDAAAIAFGFEAHPHFPLLARCYIHAAPCRDYPEED